MIRVIPDVQALCGVDLSGLRSAAGPRGRRSSHRSPLTAVLLVVVLLLPVLMALVLLLLVLVLVLVLLLVLALLVRVMVMASRWRMSCDEGWRSLSWWC